MHQELPTVAMWSRDWPGKPDNLGLSTRAVPTFPFTILSTDLVINMHGAIKINTIQNKLSNQPALLSYHNRNILLLRDCGIDNNEIILVRSSPTCVRLVDIGVTDSKVCNKRAVWAVFCDRFSIFQCQCWLLINIPHHYVNNSLKAAETGLTESPVVELNSQHDFFVT